MKKLKYSFGLVILTLAALLTGSAQAQQPVVRAVLFYSPTCGHCHYVITEVLPPLGERYGDQLQLVGVDTTSPNGQILYQAAIERFDISEERRGVPALIVGATVLVGSLEIPEQFPVLIEQYLAQGGVDWPGIPGLTEALAASQTVAQPTADPTPEPTGAPTSSAAEAVLAQPSPVTTEPAQVALAHADSGITAADTITGLSEEPAAEDLVSKLRRDPAGNLLAILMLAGMLAVFVFATVRAVQAWPDRSQSLLSDSRRDWRDWAVAGLCLVGLGVSMYMAFVETTHTTAVCGPVGDCNTVQQSSYAFLFGRLPVGVLGVLGYAAMLVVWAGRRWGRGKLSHLSELALFAMAFFGTLFSIYLTFLEPFVIGATCIWCLTSALCMTLILLILARSVALWPNRLSPV